MSRILVIANQTLRSWELRSVIAERISSGGREFVVAVPMTGVADLVCVDQYGIPVPCGEIDAPMGADDAWSKAEGGIESLLETIRSLGATASAAAGDPDPWVTFKALESTGFDEVIVSTLPASLSRWLRMDVVSRIRRVFAGPVREIAAGSAQPA